MRPARTIMALAAVVAIVLTACGDDDDDSASDATTATTAAASATTAAGSTDTTAATANGQTVTVKAIDYEFQGLPATVAPGTKFTLENDAPSTLHEMVALKLPAGETRSVDEILALPQEEQDKIIPEDQPPAFVLLAQPNKGEVIPAVGDGTVTEPGRYLVICGIPIGVTPEQYLAAANSGGDGPPDIPGAGPPHFTKGMIGEFTVK
jgi:hypothetical protein